MDFDKLSRRDFLKKTTVLAVGVASVTLFSGLVNAVTYTVNAEPEECFLTRTTDCTAFEIKDGDGKVTGYIWFCNAECSKNGKNIPNVTCDDGWEVQETAVSDEGKNLMCVKPGPTS